MFARTTSCLHVSGLGSMGMRLPPGTIVATTNSITHFCIDDSTHACVLNRTVKENKLIIPYPVHRLCYEVIYGDEIIAVLAISVHAQMKYNIFEIWDRCQRDLKHT